MSDVLLGLADPPSAPVTRTLRRLRAVAPPFTSGVGATIVLALAGTLALLAGPLVVQRILDVHLVGSTGSIDVAAVTWLGVGAMTIGLLGAAANRLAVERMLTATAQGAAHLRVAALDRLHALDLLHVQAERRGALVSRVTGDVSALTDFMGWGGVGFVVGLVRVIAALGALLVLDWRIALAVAPALLLYGITLRVTQRVVEQAHDRVRSHVSVSLSAVGEAIAGLRTIRVHGAQEHTRARVDDAVEEQFRAEVRAGAIGAVMFSSADVAAAALTAVAVGAAVLLDGVSVGVAVAALFLLTLLLDPVQTMVEVLPEAQSAMAGLRRVLVLLDTPVAVDDRIATAVLPPGAIGIETEGLTYAYPNGAVVLDDVTVSVRPRGHVAVVGETGSGKTTFVKLVARLLHGASGSVTIGGVPLDTIAEASLRDRVAFVPQEVFLFDATLRANLVPYGREVDDEELRSAFAQLGLDEWLDGLPDGLDTQVGERGGRLSAGERQLVALTRAALLDPDLLLLDEATSAVDPELEVRLRRAVERLGEHRTVVTVAHRLSTAETADTVLVFDAGRLAQVGTHAELLEQDGPYAGLHADWTVGTTS